MSQTWQRCVKRLEAELTDTDVNTWIRPLQAFEGNTSIQIMAPNRFVEERVSSQFLDRITQIIEEIGGEFFKTVHLDVGSQPAFAETNKTSPDPIKERRKESRVKKASPAHAETNLNKNFTFENFVEGKANQLARASAQQVAKNPGQEFSNPMFLYGGVGLGKTHLMHAIGNKILEDNPDARVLYLHSERFVADMVSALQHNAIERFKDYYRSLNALLIDDIQFFAGKERSQEEFFHTFNALLEGQQQIILTSDRYPKEVDGLEERLKSRFGYGLTAEIKSPELETRVAILQSKSLENFDTELPADIAFFIAKHIRSNIRELEGALRRVMAGARFMGKEINMEYVKETLQDLLAMHDRMITLESIQKMVCEYFGLRMADLLSKKRSRSIARPRQLAMALAKDLTQHSLPEIGDAFGGRDHTTVLHATRKIAELKGEDNKILEDYNNLSSRLTS